MDGSVYKKKLSQLHSKSLLRDSDEISLWELLGFLEKNNVFFFHWCDFPFSGVVQSCCQCFSQRRHSPCTLFWWNEPLIEERMNWFYFCKMNNAETLEWNHWKSAMLWRVSPRGLWTESWMLLHHRQTPWTLPPSHLPQIMEKKNNLFAVSVLQPFSHTSITRWGWARGRMSS